MHRELYVLQNEKSIDKAIKGFIYSALDLYSIIDEDCKYEYELTDEIKNEFKKYILENKENVFNFLSWITYQLDNIEISYELRYRFLQKFLEILD